MIRGASQLLDLPIILRTLCCLEDLWAHQDLKSLSFFNDFPDGHKS